jgi:hypothetical protein
MRVPLWEKAHAFDDKGQKLQTATLDFSTVKACDSSCFYVKTIKPTMLEIFAYGICRSYARSLTLQMMGKG